MIRRAPTAPKAEDISAAILAGGTSRRMGTDKALLLHDGKPLIRWVCEAVTKVFTNIFLVTSDPARLALPWIPSVPDRITGQGPLGGIDAAIRHASTEFTFITGCDMPFLSPAVLRYLAARAHGCDIVIPSGPNGLEPLCAIYGKGCLPYVEEALDAGQRNVFRLIDQVHALVVPAVEIATVDPEFLSFLNVNTPDDCRRLKKNRYLGEGQPMKQIPAVAIVGNSGAGKTTLLEQLIPALKGKGIRVGVVKHDAHRFDIDHPGKDSHRFTAAGADTMVITSKEKLAMVKRHAAPPPIEELLERYFSDMDLVLVEGFRGSSLPKIEVHRKEFRSTLICRGERDDPGLAAVASDEPLDLDVPILDLNDPKAIAEFIASLVSGIE